jgi:hypothetical protein
MGLKRTELYRGFNIYLEEARAGAWAFALVEVPASDSGEHAKSPQQGRVPGHHPSKEAVLLAAHTHIDRIQQNRKNRAGG